VKAEHVGGQPGATGTGGMLTITAGPSMPTGASGPLAIGYSTGVIGTGGTFMRAIGPNVPVAWSKLTTFHYDLDDAGLPHITRLSFDDGATWTEYRDAAATCQVLPEPHAWQYDARSGILSGCLALALVGLILWRRLVGS
jgi:hypothetical protein